MRRVASGRRPLKRLLWVSEVFSNADSLGRPGNLVHVTSGSEEDLHELSISRQQQKDVAEARQWHSDCPGPRCKLACDG